MKLHADAAATGLATITGYGVGYIEVNAVPHHGHLLVVPHLPTAPWAVASFDALSAADFDALLHFAPEVVLLGTGSRQRLLHPRLAAALTRAGVGIDAMDTPAACRTYNILMAEGRRVLAALLQDTP